MFIEQNNIKMNWRWQFKNILELSEPIAAASIAQVHAKIKMRIKRRSCN